MSNARSCAKCLKHKPVTGSKKVAGQFVCADCLKQKVKVPA